MIAEIQKLEAAARMAMGHFEGLGSDSPEKPRSRFWRPAYTLSALAIVAFAIVLV